MNINSTESNIMPKFNYRDLIIFLVPLLIFSLYLFVYNPGVLTVASFNQLHQIATSIFTTSSPIFHTMLEKFFLKFFGSPFYIGLFQILIFSVIWMVICKYHRNDYAKSSNEFVVQFIITLIICLIPINAVYSITLSSNVLFSYSLMFLAFLIKVMIDKDGQIDTKLLIIMALTIGVMSGLNNYGIIIAILTLISITYYLFKKGNYSENTFVMFVGLAVLFIFLIGSLNFVLDVHTDKTDIKTNDAFEEDINIKHAQDEFFSSINAEPSNKYENVAPANLGKSNYNLIDSFVDFWRGNFILDSLFDNPIVSLILSIMLLALIYLITRLDEIFLVYVPIFLNFIIALLTGQNNLYSIILAFYMITIICVCLYFKLNLKEEDLSNIKQIINKPQKIETQHKFEVEENNIDDNNYSHLESEIEDLTLDDINEILGKTQNEKSPEVSQSPESSDLIDEILKEIELEKK